MSRIKVRPWWQRVKAWLAERLSPAVVLEVVPELRCRSCHRVIQPADLFVWDSMDYHKDCLARLRSWNLEAEDPADVLPNLSIHRFDAEREAWPDVPAGARLN